jgi:hypothetical protein
LSPVTGVFPVADDQPCPSIEVAAFAAELLHVPLPQPSPLAELPETLQGGRRVDGRAVRRKLGLTLRFPTYREGVRHALL